MASTQNQRHLAGTQEKGVMFEIDAALLGTPIPLFSLQESTPKVGGSPSHVAWMWDAEVWPLRRSGWLPDLTSRKLR